MITSASSDSGCHHDFNLIEAKAACDPFGSFNPPRPAFREPRLIYPIFSYILSAHRAVVAKASGLFFAVGTAVAQVSDVVVRCLDLGGLRCEQFARG